MANELSDQVLKELLKKVIEIEKKYAHELAGVRNDRRADLAQLINKAATDKVTL